MTRLTDQIVSVTGKVDEMDKQKTAYEIASGDWSSDVCSSDLKKNTVPGFFTLMKQQGAVLAKGRLLGIQFDTLFTENLLSLIHI